MPDISLIILFIGAVAYLVRKCKNSRKEMAKLADLREFAAQLEKERAAQIAHDVEERKANWQLYKQQRLSENSSSSTK